MVAAYYTYKHSRIKGTVAFIIIQDSKITQSRRIQIHLKKESTIIRLYHNFGYKAQVFLKNSSNTAKEIIDNVEVFGKIS